MVFKRYRHEERSDEMWADLKLVLSQSVQPMLALTHMLTSQLPQLQSNKAAVTGHIKCIAFLIKIFHSMCAQDFAAQIEESMRSWMELVHTLLTLDWLAPMYAQDDDDEDVNELLHMRKACMGTLNLFASRYQEEFAAFMPPLVKVVWELANAAPGAGYADEYVSSLMKFLSIIARSRDHAVVDGEQVMPAIVRAVVVPNVIMRTSDVERFDDDGSEYMQRDLLGADVHTRRKAAADLLKAFNSHQERSVCALGMESIQTLTQRAAAGAADAVQLKEAAISIMIAIGITSSSEVTGAVTVSPHVDSLAFFQQAIMPELQPAASGAASSPILVAAALKFIVAFRHTLGTMNLPAVLGLITPHLSNPHFVVHTYAAFAITRMLDTKVPKAAGGVPEPLINSATFAPFFGATVGGLFSVLSLPASKENEHAMRCLMRVVIVTGAAALPHAGELIQRLNAIVIEILKQCRNPLFPYYVFETLAAFLRFVCGSDAALVAGFTQAFMPQYALIKSEANAEAMLPYAWQIFSMLVQRTPAPLPPYLVAEYPLFFSPDLWSNRSNVPAMVRVLCSFVSQDAGQLLQGDGMTKLLGLTQQLVSKKSSDDQGMLLLCAIFNAVPFAQLQQYAQGIFHMMLGRLQADKTVKYNRLFLNALGLACMKFTPQTVAAALNSMQVCVPCVRALKCLVCSLCICDMRRSQFCRRTCLLPSAHQLSRAT
jgi:exportin-2 (importin alpha re-exporter)